MTKEYRTELKQIRAEEQQIKMNLIKLDRDCDREIVRLCRQNNKAVRAVNRRRNKEGRGASKLLVRLDNRRAILEGRLS